MHCFFSYRLTKSNGPGVVTGDCNPSKKGLIPVSRVRHEQGQKREGEARTGQLLDLWDSH